MKKPKKTKKKPKNGQKKRKNANIGKKTAKSPKKVVASQKIDSDRLKAVGHGFAARFFHVSPRMLYNWVDSGCPRANDGSYDLFEVHRWLLRREDKRQEAERDKRGLDDKKAEKSIEWLDVRIRKEKGLLMDAEKHKTILAARIAGLKRFWTDTFISNIHHFANKPIDALRPLANEFIKQGMNAYLSGSKQIDSE